MTGQEQEKLPKDKDPGSESGGTGGMGSSEGTGAVQQSGGAEAVASGGTGESGGTAGGETECVSGNLPPQTYLCAGNAYEDSPAGLRSTRLDVEGATWACQRYPDWYYGYYGYYDYWPMADAGYGDEAMGGFGGAIPGGGGTAGSVGVGGGGPGVGEPRSDWCDDVPSYLRLAGVTYAVGACTDTELRMPLRIEEPYGWYELTIYGGEEPCDRQTVVMKTAGNGTGEILEFPVSYGDAKFLSIELKTETWNSTVIALKEAEPNN